MIELCVFVIVPLWVMWILWEQKQLRDMSGRKHTCTQSWPKMGEIQRNLELNPKNFTGVITANVNNFTPAFCISLFCMTSKIMLPRWTVSFAIICFTIFSKIMTARLWSKIFCTFILGEELTSVVRLSLVSATSLSVKPERSVDRQQLPLSPCE